VFVALGGSGGFSGEGWEIAGGFWYGGEGEMFRCWEGGGEGGFDMVLEEEGKAARLGAGVRGDGGRGKGEGGRGKGEGMRCE